MPIKKYLVKVTIADEIYGSSKEDALEHYNDWLSKHTQGYDIQSVHYLGEEDHW